MKQTNLGTQLARLAKKAKVTVPFIVAATGATRATVYNWLSGKGVSPAYRVAVTALITKLQVRKTK